MPSDMATGFLIVRRHRERPFYECKWRDSTRTQRKRRLGPAWLEQDAEGEWVKRRGRVRDGFLDERRAHVAMAKVIEEHEAEQILAPENRAANFNDAAARWLDHLEHAKRIKPSTLADYRVMLADPQEPRKVRGKARKGRARIKKAFGGRELASISAADVRRFLSGMDHEDVSARTVNRHRQLLHSIFEFAKQEFGLRQNPVSETDKRPEGDAKPIDTFEPSEVELVATAAREGLHRPRPDHDYSPETVAEWERLNAQDADMYVIAAFTGLRCGELLALRWRDIDLSGRRLTVERSVSAGREMNSTKSRHIRTVPLADQAADALKRLGQRKRFSGRDDLVFCRTDGGALDRSSVRKRFIRSQEKAGVRFRRFHDLRHSFGSLAVRSFDAVTVQSLMGHASLRTTERYLHSRPRSDDAKKLTAAFSA